VSFGQWLSQLNFDSVISGAMIVIAALLSITFHETCHGLVAYWLGDPTAKQSGRLTLNPLRHVDLVGLAMLVIFRFGWAKPVPVDARNFRHPKRDMVLTALAGPVSNLVLALGAMILAWIFRLLFSVYAAPEVAWYLPLLLEYIAVVSIGLAVFNIIPISPLDGSKVLLAFLPTRVYMKWMRYEQYGMFVLLALLLLGILDGPLQYLRNVVYALLNFVSIWPARWLAMLLG
jgi:Zn-dependent protease